MTQIKVAQNAGFCFGVGRAVELIREEAKQYASYFASDKHVYTIGELIHNKRYVEELKEEGIFPLSADSAVLLPPRTRVAIRTHGIPKADLERLKIAGLSVLDATCPYVENIHRIAHEKTKSGKPLVIMGDPEHPEVLGIRSYAHGAVRVMPDTVSLLAFLRSPEGAFYVKNGFIVVAQTTFSLEEWKKSQNFIKKLYTNAIFFDTICCVTEQRQKEALALAKESDLVVVVGGRNSSNTRKLYDIAARYTKALYIERAAELDSAKALICAASNIAITAGASTPSSIIQEVTEHMADIIQTNEAKELSFQEMLDQNFKTLHTGERVTGVISAVTPAEIHVDLGTKHTGILPYDEITDESGMNLNEMFKVGDEIEVVPVKFNDAEGVVSLSKKRLDSSKNWNRIVEAEGEHAVLEGIVKEVVKGGVVVSSNNVRVFIPASQSGVPKDEQLEELKGKKVKFKIIEINEQRKRAVGSIKLALRAERKKAAEEFYASVEVGQKFVGTVRSLTSFGAFVNLGPVDGMVHITELSWGRLRNPADVLKVGDTLPVYVKAVDAEKKRISLGYKTEENNPWNIFFAEKHVGDVINVKIVSLMPFGAFAEIIPGVDGLIHNSQLAAKPVSAPGTVVAVGDEIEVKIIAIDEERKRISLSRRALLSPDELGTGFEIADETEATPAEDAAVATEESAE